MRVNLAYNQLHADFNSHLNRHDIRLPEVAHADRYATRGAN